MSFRMRNESKISGKPLCPLGASRRFVNGQLRIGGTEHTPAAAFGKARRAEYTSTFGGEGWSF